jgi:hypothetical protein
MHVALKAILFLRWKITKNKHYNKSEYYVTSVFLFNKEVDKFFPNLCFGEISLQFVKILVFILLNCFWQNDWIFNNSHTISLNNMKPPLYTSLHKGFSNNTNCAMGGTWFGGFQHNKQNKLPFLIDRFFYCWLFHFVFMSLLVMVLSFCGSMLFNIFPILWFHQRLDHPEEKWTKFNLHMWNMKLKTFNHPSTFIAISKSLYKNLVIWNFFFLEFGKFRPFFVQISLLTSKCHF